MIVAISQPFSFRGSVMTLLIKAIPINPGGYLTAFLREGILLSEGI
jgi:hypothetical protein